MALDRSASVPVWRQILSDIEFEIRSGLISPGQKLPSEQEFSQRYGVNRHTVRAALIKLADKGLVVSRQGVGVFVTDEQPEYRVTRHSRWTEIEHAMNAGPTGELIASYRRTASQALAGMLQTAVDAELLVLETVRQASSRLLAYGYHYFDATRFGGIDIAFARTRSLTAALAEYGCDSFFRRSTWIDTRMPRQIEAAALGIELDDPVIVMSYVDADAGSRPVLFGNTVLRGGAIRVRVETP